MPATYDFISKATLGADAASITLSSIPSTYTDLRLIVAGSRTATGGIYWTLTYNGDTGANYGNNGMITNGTTMLARSYNSQNYIYVGDWYTYNTTNPSTASVDIFDYATTNKNKTCAILGSYDNNGTGGVNMLVGLWMNTAAINSITIGRDTANADLAAGFTISLYGILKA